MLMRGYTGRRKELENVALVHSIDPEVLMVMLEGIAVGDRDKEEIIDKVELETGREFDNKKWNEIKRVILNQMNVEDKSSIASYLAGAGDEEGIVKMFWKNIEGGDEL